MFLQLFAIYLFGLAGGGHGDLAAAGPILDWRANMPQHVPKPDPAPTGQPASKTRVITLLLKDFQDPAKHEDPFGLRFRVKYQPETNPELIESIKVYGLLEMPHVAKRKDGGWELICGHRRIACLYILAGRNVPGFSLNMQVQCLEILEGSYLDLLRRSITDNELGERLEPKERLLATKKADDAGATKKDIATMLGVSEKSIDRDLKIVRHPRVLQHVMDENLPPTAASTLAEVAVAKGRLDEFLDYFDGFTDRKKKEIEDEDRRAKKERGKGLRPNQMFVANRLEPHVVRGWLDALAKGRPLTEEADLGFEAVFDRKTAKAVVKVKVDAQNDPVEYVARVAGQISQVARHLASVAQTRHELEAPEGPQAALKKDDSFLDRDLLRQFGLEDVAAQLEQELHAPEDFASGMTSEDNASDATAGT